MIKLIYFPFYKDGSVKTTASSLKLLADVLNKPWYWEFTHYTNVNPKWYILSVNHQSCRI